jgi:hypothetical protein
MKKLTLILLTVIAISATAQTRSEIELIKDVFKVEKKAVVADFLKLNDDQASKFWPLYDKYEAERGVIANMRLDNITNYVNEYLTLTDEQADVLAKKKIEIETKTLALRKKYYKIVSKELGALKAASFLQLEEYIALAIDASIYDSLPLVGEND